MVETDRYTYTHIWGRKASVEVGKVGPGDNWCASCGVFYIVHVTGWLIHTHTHTHTHNVHTNTQAQKQSPFSLPCHTCFPLTSYIHRERHVVRYSWASFWYLRACTVYVSWCILSLSLSFMVSNIETWDSTSKRALFGNIIHQNDPHGTSIVRCCDRSEPFLPRSVPDL